MHVRKRNGSLEAVDLNKIVSSLQSYCSDLPNIDVFKIAQKTVGGLVDGVGTRELDLLSVRTAKDLIIEDPVYSKVAARILANVIHKEVSGQDIQSFSQSISLGFEQGLIGEQTHKLVLANKRKLNAAVHAQRDWNFEFHGLQTVYDRYLLKHRTRLFEDGGKKQRAVIETPQYFFMRVACGLSNDASEAVELYNLLSSLEYMCSTPTLFNSGTAHSQMSSCFVAGTKVQLANAQLKNIEDVEIGDSVYTHKHRIRQVTQVHKNLLEARSLHDVSVYGCADFTATGNHKLWAAKRAESEDGSTPVCSWISVDDLDEGDWVAITFTHTPGVLELIVNKDSHDPAKLRMTVTGFYDGTLQRNVYTTITRKVSSASKPVYVYDLGVKEDHSYNVNGVICSNCYLLDSPNDDLTDIYKRYGDIAMLSKFAGGIGVSASRIRGKGSLIRGTNGKSNGLTPWLHTMSGSVAAVNQCLHPDTQIYTKDGIKAISTVEVNDLVLGISGYWRPVQEVLNYKASEERSIAISVRDNIAPVILTDGHPVYAIAKKMFPQDATNVLSLLGRGAVRPEWIDAGELEIGDFVCVPALYSESITAEHQDTMTNLAIGDATFGFDGKVWNPILSITEATTADEVFDLRVETDETYTVVGALVHNGGKRKGAACVYLETHHPDIMEFLELRDNTGEKEQRAYNLNLANWVSDLFMERVKADATWSLIDPTVGPDLVDLYGDAYKARYEELEAAGKFTEQLPARKVYARMMRTLAETGNGWMTFKDTANRRGNQVGHGNTIKLSNLCSEILEVTSSGTQRKMSREQIASMTAADLVEKNINIIGFDTKTDQFNVLEGSETAVCNLGSINIGRGYVKNGKLDRDKLRRNVATAIKFLDRVIDRNFYPIPEAHASNSRWRPVGLGMMGLADLFFQLRLPFESDEAAKLSADIQEEIYYCALKTSNELAIELGAHRDFALTRLSKGEFQFDLAGVKVSDVARWDALRNSIMEHGVRNSLVLALAPTACGLGTNRIRTEHGVMSYYDILDANGIDHAAIESTNEQMWIPIKPMLVDTREYQRTARKIWFNGVQPTYKITYDDAAAYEYTSNHMLYVVSKNETGEDTSWREVWQLSVGDAIMVVDGDTSDETRKIVSITPTGSKPTWDIEVEHTHHYVMENGTVSHNTISHICGVEECIEPVKSNLLKRETLSGEFIAINRYLVDDLKKHNRWNPETVNRLKADEGSIANIADLPAEMYALYKTVWEMSMKSIINHAAARGAFIDQGASTNLFIDLNKYSEDKRIGILSSLYMMAWEKGLKTTYYFRSRAATRIEQTTTTRGTTTTKQAAAAMAPETTEACESCT